MRDRGRYEGWGTGRGVRDGGQEEVQGIRDRRRCEGWGKCTLRGKSGHTISQCMH